jgi:hypothetical protein
MRLTFYTKIVFAVIVLIGVNSASGGRGSVATIWPDPLLGTWTNRNPAGSGTVMQLVISRDSRSGTGTSVIGSGACAPPCGIALSAPATLYSAGVSSPAAVAFKAQEKLSDRTVTAVGYLKGQVLEVETFTEFTDGSGRYSFHMTDQMVR